MNNPLRQLRAQWPTRLAASWLAVLLVAPAAVSAAESAAPDFPDSSFEGVYEVTGTTDTGATRTLQVVVTSVSAEEILFETQVAGFDFSVSGPPTWEGPNRVTVPLAKSVPLLGSGTGMVAFDRTEEGWTLDATGEGRVLATNASATGEGPRTDDLPPTSTARTPSVGAGNGVPSNTIVWIAVVVAALLVIVGVVAWGIRRSTRSRAAARDR